MVPDTIVNMIRIEEAIQKAKQVVLMTTDDGNPSFYRFEQKDGFRFEVGTTKGDYSVWLDANGELLSINRGAASNLGAAMSPRQMESPQNQARHNDQTYQANGQRIITESEAVNIALGQVGGGRVKDVEKKADGYEVEIEKGMFKGEHKVFVGNDGKTYNQGQKKKREFFDFDFD
jgi:hypothetical protein